MGSDTPSDNSITSAENIEHASTNGNIDKNEGM